ncbi:MAG TPA: DUF5615 family PIN-like protein [Caldilineaceae bacterium]|nr:DUF5615 family PIN-like protein [Caldilineaceae bacterium]
MARVEALCPLGHDVLTIHEDGKANQRYPDEAVLAEATAGERAVLTLNRKHFIRLHERSSSHTGIILCTYDPDFVGQARRIDKALRSMSSLMGILVRINCLQSDRV